MIIGKHKLFDVVTAKNLAWDGTNLFGDKFFLLEFLDLERESELHLDPCHIQKFWSSSRKTPSLIHDVHSGRTHEIIAS